MNYLPHPAQVFMDVNLECNLKCVQCDIHKLKNPSNELKQNERMKIIDEIAEWWPGTNLVFTGGENLLRRQLLYDLAKHSKNYGIYTTLSSNGTLINDHDIELLPSSGINDVVISLDSHNPVIHDRIRGRTGCHETAVRSIKKLVNAKKHSSTNFHVLTSTILGNHNIGEIRELVEYIESLGVDAMLLQPIQPVFNRPMDNDWWQSNPLFPKDINLIDNGIDKLILFKKDGKPLYQQEYQFEDMRNYLKNKGTCLPGQCISASKNLMVDIVGNVRICFNMERIGLSPLGNVRDKPLHEFWNGYNDIRERMITCRECCGVMVCHAR